MVAHDIVTNFFMVYPDDLKDTPLPSGSSQPDNPSGSHEGARQIEAEQVRFLYTQAPAGSAGAMLVAGIVVFALWKAIAHPILISWFALMVVVTLPRFVLVWMYRRAAPSVDQTHRWRTLFILGAGSSGLVWGAAGILLFSHESLIYQVFLVFILALMAGGAIIVTSPVMAVAMAFLIPTLLPITVRFFLQSDDISVAIGSLLLLYVGVLLTLARNLHASIAESLNLRFENLDLVQNLSVAKDQAESVNRQLAGSNELLKQEINDRKAAEEALQRAHKELELRVKERTAELQRANSALKEEITERKRAEEALAHANTELHLSLKQLEQAYRDLQHSQENLLKAERMAALGRLAAGIAHEMNTPLGASLTSLKLVQELVEEYQASISDPEVTEGDHQDIAAEMDRLVRTTQQWMEKAASYIRSLKLHTRDFNQREERAFSVPQIIEAVGLLLSHRLRLSQCTLSVSCTSSEPILYGDSGKLGQVLTNLIVNATDAYKDAGKDGGEIRVEVSEEGGFLEIRVKDRGCGISAETLEKIFEEFFSTKPLGEGTGLGLSIARDIVTNFFGGVIGVESAPGQGSTFILRLPRGRRREEERPIFEEWASAVSD